MDPQIHGAIVGGLIGGPIVGLSLAGEHWLSRLGAHRADVEATVTELDQLVRRVAERVLTKRFDRKDIALTAAHNADIDRFHVLVVTIIRRARWPMRHAAEVRAEARRVNRAFANLIDHWHRGRRPTLDRYTDITNNRLPNLVFGEADLSTADEPEGV
jgi:hypothetical protein